MRASSCLAVLAIAATAHADPAPPAAADPQAALNALLARTDAVSREVSKLRGLPLKRKIPYDLVDRDEMRARLLADASDPKSRAEDAADALRLARWGEIPLMTNYDQTLLDVMTEQVAGYYDPKTKKLTVSKSAADDTSWAEMVQSHEIEHGLQDQSYDLQKFTQLGDTEGDAEAARRAVVEGDGIAVMVDVALTRAKSDVDWTAPEAVAAMTSEMASTGAGSAGSAGSGSSSEFDRAPLAIREDMLFAYRDGFAFIAALHHRNPWSAVNVAFTRPPKSTEQILHPEKYFAHDDPIPVKLAVPPSLKEWKIGASTVWGELGFDLFLRAHGVETRAAAIAAEGWGGDRNLVLVHGDDRAPEHAIGIARMDWDSEADAIEAAEAATRAMDDAAGSGRVEHTDALTRWASNDGTMSWVERRGSSVILARGVPNDVATAVAGELWTASSPKLRAH